MVSEMIMQKDVRIIDAMIAMNLWCGLVIAVELISLKSAKTRVLLDGEPAIVIKKGHIDERSLKKHRLNMDDLAMQLRLHEIFSITDVDYAILEPNGALTVMKKQEKAAVTREDMQIAPKIIKAGLPSEIIVDGKIVEKNLRELGYDRLQLDGELRKQNITDIKNVLYAELQQDGSLHIQTRKKQ